MNIDKVLLKFLADVLYLKGIICYQEHDDIMNVCIPSDLDIIIEKIFKEDYNGYMRGDFNV